MAVEGSLAAWTPAKSSGSMPVGKCAESVSGTGAICGGDDGGCCSSLVGGFMTGFKGCAVGGSMSTGLCRASRSCDGLKRDGFGAIAISSLAVNSKNSDVGSAGMSFSSSWKGTNSSVVKLFQLKYRSGHHENYQIL